MIILLRHLQRNWQKKSAVIGN